MCKTLAVADHGNFCKRWNGYQRRGLLGQGSLPRPALGASGPSSQGAEWCTLLKFSLAIEVLLIEDKRSSNDGPVLTPSCVWPDNKHISEV